MGTAGVLQHAVSPAIRAEILAVQQGEPPVLERLTRLHFTLGHLYADAVERLIEAAGIAASTLDMVASHGQTVCHFPVFPDRDSGFGDEKHATYRPALGGWTSAATLQIGEPSVIAERLGVPVISNFRSRDVVVGGTGAPLVPLVDHLLFSHAEKARLVVNIGGIANLTALAAGGERENVIAFDSGPGNMVMDAVVERLSDGKQTYDQGGAWARKGTPDRDLVSELLQAPYFTQVPPKATGREQFGAAFVDAFLDRTRAAGLTPAATVATATWLTAAALREAYERFVQPRVRVDEVIVSGGAHNATLMGYLSELFGRESVVPSDYYGLDVDAKEATAFALLGHLSIDGQSTNIPAVTGARRHVLLGDITPGDRFL